MAHQQHNEDIQFHSSRKIHERSQIKNTDNTETKHNPEKANTAKLNYPGLVTFYTTLSRGF